MGRLFHLCGLPDEAVLRAVSISGAGEQLHRILQGDPFSSSGSSVNRCEEHVYYIRANVVIQRVRSVVCGATEVLLYLKSVAIYSAPVLE